MANMYVARLKNARRMFNKIKRYLREGYFVFDGDNYRILSVTYKTCNYSRDNNHIAVSINDMFIYLISDPMMANGMEMTIKEFNDQFKSWTVVHPKSFNPL